MEKNRKIVRGSTPSFILTYKEIKVEDIDDIVLVVKQADIPVIELEKDRAEYNLLENSIAFTLTQRETLGLDCYKTAVVSADWMTDDVRGFSDEVAYKVVNPAKNDIMGGGE